MFRPIVLLLISNLFMTFAWYGHLKTLKSAPLWTVILVSWAIAFFEYCFQVPGNVRLFVISWMRHCVN
jgi:uncharacterized protein